MNAQIVIDAGPALNFFATNQQRLLFGVLGSVTAPSTVIDEVRAKSASDARFCRAAAVLSKLPEKRLRILPDDETPKLAAAVRRICDTPMAVRLTTAENLGETMVVAHAVVAAEKGTDVFVLIDDGGGAHMATVASRRIDRLCQQGKPFGSIRLISTCAVLEKAAAAGLVTNRADMRARYERMRNCDDGLVPIDQTQLLAKANWRHLYNAPSAPTMHKDLGRTVAP